MRVESAAEANYTQKADAGQEASGDFADFAPDLMQILNAVMSMLQNFQGAGEGASAPTGGEGAEGGKGAGGSEGAKGADDAGAEPAGSNDMTNQMMMMILQIIMQILQMLMSGNQGEATGGTEQVAEASGDD